MLDRLHDALGLRTSPRIYFGALAIIVIFVAGTIAFTEPVDSAFAGASGWLLTNMGWFYIFGVTAFLVFLTYLAVSRFGRVKLGPEGEGPEHSGRTWFGMLFAAGIGTILMFWGVAEPINHFANPPMGDVEGGSPEAIREALGVTFYHFGLHTWTIFCLPALAFAYFMYKRNLPPRVSSVFHPILGDRIHGPLGAAIDVAAIVGTMFGVAVSVGLGTLQINSGLSSLWGIDESRLVQVLLIAAVTLIALISVAVGLNKGIKRLSNINIIAAVALMVFVLVTGPTLLLLKGTIEGVGGYLGMLPELAFWNDTLADSGWQNDWTVFYWAWTISWSPFVGIFIARISRGRTIRQFVVGVLAIPVTFSMIWYGIFGWAAFDIELNAPGTLIEPVVDDDDPASALFVFLESFPVAPAVSAVAILIVIIFFTTSVDSSALVMDMISNGHEEKAPTRQRLAWGVGVGAVAATLLGATGEGGLSALQQVIIVVGLPFFALGYFMMYSLLRALKEDAGERPPLRTRRWRKVLPPEEAQRRVDEAGGTPEQAALLSKTGTVGKSDQSPGREVDGAGQPTRFPDDPARS
ncbi:BCCT family transporter [Bogoriella caseilytica]|uniref:Choline/carnitine/betaine transport n=1 Tax=Bogoriella caseilytica TaxID=56055 RepID=A0A3N2BG44_9MICO|nr:BCCT family transporter [Bogoriella caseilytica]ROR74034.1 choline/carnitine/betaine transport [Bogoriella caseilytica]